MVFMKYLIFHSCLLFTVLLIRPLNLVVKLLKRFKYFMHLWIASVYLNLTLLH